MTYTEQPWLNGAAGSTPLSASRMEHMEKGIKAADEDANRELLTIGEATMPRRSVSSTAVSTVAGSLRLTYFTARITETITQVRTLSGGTAAVGSTLCRVGVYSVDAGTGDLTLVADTTNDTALWVATNTSYTKSFAASFAKTRGTRYAVGILCVGASTAPTMAGQASIAASETAREPRLCAFLSSQTDLPSSIAAGSLTASANQIYAVLLP